MSDGSRLSEGARKCLTCKHNPRTGKKPCAMRGCIAFDRRYYEPRESDEQTH